MIQESVLNFGPGGGPLVGVLARRAVPGATRAAGRVAFVLLNSGIIHRVGPHRLYVRLARRLAGSGVPTLRMDLPGIGDSATLPGGQPIEAQNVHAVTAAMDQLQAAGVADRFVVLGLCAGANHGFQAACVDPRVVGLVMIDPPTLFPTPRHRLLRALATARRPEVWGRLLGGRYEVLSRLRARPEAGVSQAPPGPSMDEVKGMVRDALVGLVGRGVELFLVVTGDQRSAYSYRDQFLDAFPGIGLERSTRISLIAEANHTFTAERDRARLEHDLLEWVGSVPFDAAPGDAENGTSASRPNVAGA